MQTTELTPRAGRPWIATLVCLVLVIGGAIGAIALIGTESAAAATVGTQRVVVRPVTTARRWC